MGTAGNEKNRRKGGTFFILAGLLLLCGAIGLFLYNRWDSDRAGRASQEILEQMEEQLEEQMSENAQSDEVSLRLPNFTEKPEQIMPTMEIDGYLYIGILEIPSIDRRLPVMEVWDYDRLKISPCRYSGSYFSNDLVICGHNYARHFSPIKGLDIGADVYFITADNAVYHYVVSNRKTVEPTSVDEMVNNSDKDWQLSLFTCNTGGQTRCAVRCQLVK